MKHKVGTVKDFAGVKMREVQVNGAPYLVANIDGAWYSMEGRCSHMGGVMANGTLEGFVAKCPKHGSRFDVRTGNVISGPKIPLIGKARQMRTFPVTIEGEDVYLELGN